MQKLWSKGTKYEMCPRHQIYLKLKLEIKGVEMDEQAAS
jgi:hypothetical protein